MPNATILSADYDADKKAGMKGDLIMEQMVTEQKSASERLRAIEMEALKKEKSTNAAKRNDALNQQGYYNTNCTRSATTNISMERCLITPEVAREMLATMKINRNVKPVRVKKYADDMANGRWGETPAPIIFGTDGCLIDGQHRLMAIIKSNTPAVFWIARNVPTDTPIDIGLPRSSADSLRCRGKISEEMARGTSMALVNALFRLKGYTLGAVSDDDRAIILNKFGAEILLAVSISSTGANSAIMRKCGCTVAIFAAILNGVEIDRLYGFSKCVNSGEISHEQRAALKLREALLKPRRETGGSNGIASITEQAVYDFVRNFPRQQAYKTGVFPYSKNIRMEDLLK